ncbi:MAG: hypothetical protein QOJ13_587 [Gaiellales bacterium]|jgi:hypothetical protein|nr:hypothetical protein [Gaiellales bacterium]
MAEDMGLDLDRHRDLRGRDREPWVRRAGIALLTLIPIAALLNTFGQSPTEAVATGPGVRMSVLSPEAGRGGVIFQVRVTIDPSSAIQQPRLILGDGWLEGLTLNTVEPSPSDEQWGPDGLELSFPPVEADGRLVVYLQYQVNPTTVDRRTQHLELRDGTTPLARIDRTFTVYP